MEWDKALWNKAISLLARREYSRAELEQKLKPLAENENLDALLQALEEAGYQSDKRFTESFIRMRVGQGHGLIRIRFDLQRKGIESEQISECLDEMDMDWYENARELYQRKYAEPLQSGDHKTRNKRMRYLSQRGYTMDEIRYALDAENQQ
ncbi:regulatory protein RecX [Neptuniibacter halophilus]|uniref:regulatory protein RecX n=1 Tax=Neptuniibacter halophilus TaxID=651666 RepID=UPI002573BFCD|nr:regulatory protein RecX [Neptuniibacter halophilus]